MSFEGEKKMMKRLFTSVKIVSFCLLLTCGVAAQQREKRQAHRGERSQSQQLKARVSADKYIPVHAYDPKRDADRDIKDAVTEAGRTGKRILLEVGGQWCIWCHYMDDFFEKHAELLALREKNFIMVKINFSEENKNEQVLSRYPPVKGYPHIFILDRDGKLLHSEDTSVLEEGKSYNLERFMAFLKEWSPPERESAKQ
jgi:thioredoxin-related protein